MTDSEASTLLGGTTQRTGPKEENGLVDCKWENSQAGFLLVALAQGAGFYDPELSNPGWKPVSGVGDKAFVDDATHTVGFIKGTTVVDLFVAFHTVPIADNVNLAVRWPAGSDRPGPLRRSRGWPTVGAFDASISDYQPSA